MKHSVFVIIMALAMFSCNAQPRHAADPADTPAPQADTTLTVDEAIGMMLMVGFRGTSVSEKGTPDIVSALREYHVGSVILFDYDAPTGKRGRNIQSPKQVRRLCAQLRGYNPNLIIGIDQEGGLVSRLAPRYGFPRFLSAEQCAAMGDDTLRHYARLTGRTLAGLGINLNFAPVADVNVNPQCPVIGHIHRSFSADPTRVTHCCRLWSSVQGKEGVAGCLKHFPGHGSAQGDTHMGLTDVSDTWQRLELEPYRDLDDPHTMVMTAHVINRRLDPSGLPASLSPAITSYLRDTLGFRGVIVTDDLAMGAITGQYTFETAVRMAVLAGADLLCLSNNGSGVYDPQMTARAVAVIKQMLADGDIAEQRVVESARRVRRAVAF